MRRNAEGRERVQTFLSIVTPVGGIAEDARTTQASIALAALRNPEIYFEHIFVLNNGSEFVPRKCNLTNLNLHVIDINPIANRSTARDTGTASTSIRSNYTLYLDAGDILLPKALTELPRSAKDAHVFDSIIKTEKKYFMRRVRSEALISVVNPFYIGATWVPTKLARVYKFEDGRKEDWKHWVKMRRNGVKFIRHAQINYVYTIKSRGSHAARKSRLLQDQVKFFRDFLDMSFVKAAAATILHYFFQVVWWAFPERVENEEEVKMILHEIEGDIPSNKNAH